MCIACVFIRREGYEKCMPIHYIYYMYVFIFISLCQTSLWALEINLFFPFFVRFEWCCVSKVKKVYFSDANHTAAYTIPSYT